MHNRAKEFITDVEHTLIDAAKLMKPKESDADTTINTPNSSTQFNTIQSLLSKIHRMKVGKADSIEVAERLYRLISQTVEPQSFVDFHDSLKNIDGVNHFAYSIEDKVAAVFEGINIDPDAVMKFV